MTTEHDRIDDGDLHAYADGRLEAERREAVERVLADDPAAAQRVRDWQVQNAAIAAAFGTLAEEPVPARLCPKTMARNRRAPWMRIAAALVLVTVGFGGGWLARDRVETTAPGVGTLAADAISAHRVYAVEVRHPVEVDAAQEAHLVKWLSKRLDHPLRVPDLGAAGFRLVGGRLLPADGEAAAQFMFEDASGRRITLYTARNAENTETAFQYLASGKTGAFYWLDGPVGYAIIGDVDRQILLDLAHAVYEQIGR